MQSITGAALFLQGHFVFSQSSFDVSEDKCVLMAHLDEVRSMVTDSQKKCIFCVSSARLGSSLSFVLNDYILHEVLSLRK